MKKKILCILLALTIILTVCFVGRNSSKMLYDSENLLKEINVVRDAHGHIIQQIFYHEQTGEYIMKEFTYSYENGKAVCIDQKTTIISSTAESDISTANSLTIYYNSELEIRPAVIMDNEYARITVKKFLSRDSWWEFGYDIEVLNKTNKVISIAFDNVYIMDISCQPLFSIDHIDAGKTANFLLGWDKETLERCYIPYIDNIEFMVRVFDNETWDSTALTGSRVLFKN